MKDSMKELNDKELQNVAGGHFVGNVDSNKNDSQSGTSTPGSECLPYKKKDCEKEGDCAWDEATSRCSKK